MKKVIAVFIILLILLGAIAFVLNNPDVNLNFFAKQSTVQIDGHTFQVEVAKTQKDQEIGLSNRQSLAKDHGMLFIFAKPTTPSFWMRNMKFSLDIIFISNNKIVTMYKNIPATSEVIYTPTQNVDNVLEINSGLSDAYHINVGDSVTISL